jgi:aminodeoxyfutalosine deaminase
MQHPSRIDSAAYPKIELHVHVEQAVDAATLLAIARRNDVALPASTVEGLAELMRFRDLASFIEVARSTMGAFCTARDFADAVAEYARRAHEQGAVYLEVSLSPGVHARRGVAVEEALSGACEGAERAGSEHGIEVRITPDISRDMDLDGAWEIERQAARHRDQGVIGIGIAGPEVGHPSPRFAPVFAAARADGLASLPHAGEAEGAAAVWETLEALDPIRLRHGVRAAEDPALLRELADRGIVCDVCLYSNLRLGLVDSIAEHPLPQLLAAGVPCTVNTDDPTFFDCDLTAEHAAALSLGATPRSLFEAGLHGARCDAETRERLAAMLGEFDEAIA